MPVTRGFAGLLCTLVLCGSCFKAKHQPSTHDAPARDAGSDASPPQQEHDAGTPDASPPETRHMSCSAPLPEVLPESPGKPGASKPLACADLPVLESCDDELNCLHQGLCIRPVPHQPGLCVGNSSCALDGVPVSYAGGQCLSCLEPDVLRIMCCMKVTGVDCTPLSETPAGNQKLGSLCHVHDDCEKGLLCRGNTSDEPGAGLGRCLCPESDPDALQNGADCAQMTGPKSWGEDSPPATQHCIDKTADGFAIELLLRNLDLLPGFDVVIDAQDHIRVLVRSIVDADGFTLSATTLTYVVFANQQRSEFTPLPDMKTGFPSLFVDAHGAAHAFAGPQIGLSVSYASNASGSWSVETLGPDDGNGLGAALTALYVAADDTVHLTYIDAAFNQLHYLHSGTGGFVDRVLRDDMLESYALAFSPIAGAPTWLYNLIGKTQLQQSVLNGDSATNQQLAITGKLQEGRVSAGGEPFFVYEPARDDPDAPVEVRLAHGQSDARVWLQDLDSRAARTSPYASLALDGHGNPWVAHATPDGIVLEEPVASGFQQHVIASDYQKPIVRLDSAGEPHVFFQVHDEASGWLELRHAFRGSCQ